MILVVDDERTFDFDGNVVYCRSSESGLSTIARIMIQQQVKYAGSLDELWLDHDLGGNDDIRVVVDFLTLIDLKVDQIYVHSQNPTSDWIVPVLNAVGYNVERSALPTLTKEKEQ